MVQGAADDLDLGTAFGSAQEAVKLAGDNSFLAFYHTWYRKLEDDAKDQVGALLTRQIPPEDFVTRTQAAADAVAKDSSIEKYQRGWATGPSSAAMHHQKYRLIVPFLAPAVSLYLVFAIWPYLQSFYSALTQWSGVSPQKQFVGLDNFVRLVGDAN